MNRTAASMATTNRKMVQQELPFDEQLEPGWQGKRYLLCTDGKWHLVTRILPGNVADTQCCEDAQVILPVPTGSSELMCETCTSLHFNPKK